jgi:hypothetical protein
MDNVLSSFLIAIGFDDASATAVVSKTKKTMADYERAVVEAEKRVEDARWEGAKTVDEIAKLTREANVKEARAALAAAQEKEKAEKETAQKRQERNKEFMAGMSRLALAATAAATAISYAVNRVTQAFDNLGFVSARTGASVQSLNSLGYAFKQVGGSSQQAVSAVEKFAQALRTNDGLKSYVKGLGVDTTKDMADQLLDTVDALSKHEYQVGSREAGMLGISEEDYKLLTQYAAKVKEYRAEYDATTKSLGVNSKEAADASMAFQRTLTRLQATVSALGDKLMVSLAPALEAIVKRFQEWISANPGKVEHIMRGISDAVVWLAEKLGAMVTWFAGNEGDAFMKRWDAFADRVKAIASAFETIFGVLKKISGVTHLSTILGAYDKTIGGILAGPAAFERANGGGPGVVVAPGGPAGPVADNRSIYQRYAPTILGGKPDPNVPEGGRRGGIFRRGERSAEEFGRLNAQEPEGPGRYRKQYKVGEADLDQRVINTIAGEVSTKNPAGVDAVINNMLNRVGAKGWGPSGNLLEVARAPGQYAGYRKAGPSESEFVRQRIQAIASGGIPDNTNGSNSYRAESYYRGEGAGKTWARTSVMGPNVGGNRYGFVPGVANGPYAPYATPKDVPPPAVNITSPKIEVKGGGSGSSAAPEIHLPGVPRMMQMPGFDAKDYMKPTPEAAPSVVNNGGTSKSVSQTIHNQTTIHGAENPRQAASIMESAFGRMHNLALANAQSATV